MRKLLFLAAICGAGMACAAAPKRELTILNSQDAKVCEYFQSHFEAAPIKWQQLPRSAEGDENARATFDFENTGKPAQVFRHEDRTYVFGGSYFLVAPLGTTVATDWFEKLDMSAGLPQPPAPMRLYVQEDMNTTAEIAQFNKKNYLRTVPIREDLHFVMIFEAKDGKLQEVCRYQASQ